MRARIAGLLLALTFLLAAVPMLGCCFGAGPGPGAHANAITRTHTFTFQPPTVASAPLNDVAQLNQSTVRDESARGCTEHAAPAQTPYIETSSGSGGAPASARGSDAAFDDATTTLADAPYSGHRYGVAADDTGPPLWLTTCVSRT